MEKLRLVQSQIEILRSIDAAGIRYAVLHGWERILKEAVSDIDIIVDPSDFERLEKTLTEQSSLQIVQMFHYEARSYGFVLAGKYGTTVELIVLDVSTDYRCNGRIFFTADELLQDRRRWSGLWVLSPRNEFSFLLVKKVYEKGFVASNQWERLQELLTELGEHGRDATNWLCGKSWGKKLYEWIVNDRRSQLEQNVMHIKRSIRRQLLRTDPLNPLRYYVSEIHRVCKRWLYPTGLSLAILGPDGAGKTTLAHNLTTLLAKCFRSSLTLHFRPNALGKKTVDGAVLTPHGKQPRTWFVSLFKSFFYLADYWLGYFLTIRPKIVCSTRVIFDRYYDDILVDPRRYRYNEKTKHTHYLWKFIPAADFYLILDVPENILIHRKQEVSFPEIVRQRHGYKNLALQLPNAVVLDGSLAASEVARIGTHHVLTYLHSRYISRRSRLFRQSRSESIGWLISVLSSHGTDTTTNLQQKNTHVASSFKDYTTAAFGYLGLGDGRGYLIPRDTSRVSINALHLYNAQGAKARLSKRALAAGLQLRAAQPLLRTLKPNENGSDRMLLDPQLINYFSEVFDRRDLRFAISLGTPGPHRKPVVQILSASGDVLGYAKIGWNEHTNNLVRNEAEVLRHLSEQQLQQCSVPRLLHTGYWGGRYICIQSAAIGKVKSAPRHMTLMYFNAAREIASIHTKWIPLQESSYWKNLLCYVGKIPRNSLYRPFAEDVVSRIWDEMSNKTIVFHFCSGDFAPWNAKLINGSLFLFDWEFADAEAPVGYDLFHFFVGTLWQLKRYYPGETYQAFQKGGIAYPWVRKFMQDFGVDDQVTHQGLCLYLLKNFALNFAGTSPSHSNLEYLSKVLNLSLNLAT